MYGLDASFLLNLVILLVGVSLLIFAFNVLMSKLLGVKRPKAFSHNHVNDTHRKIDWGVRFFFIGLMVVGYFVNASRDFIDPYWFLQPWVLLFALIFITVIVRAVIERKYAKNPNAYLYTASQLVFIMILLTAIFTTDFFGVF